MSGVSRSLLENAETGGRPATNRPSRAAGLEAVGDRIDQLAATASEPTRNGAIMSLPLRPAVAAGEWVAISGQVGVANGVLVEGGISAETRQGLANLVAVLEANGLTPADVVKTNVFLVRMDDFAVMNEEYAKVFTADFPARSAVAVHQLPTGAVFEIEAWAHRGNAS